MTQFNIGFLIFPNLTQLDFTGPLQVMSRTPDSKTHIVAATLDPVPSDCGLSLVPTETMDSCPPLDFLCIPGGFGVPATMTDERILDFVRAQNESAQYMTSVCTGAFLLGAAGLLQGRKATTHWAYTSLLPLVGATHVNSRVVRDERIITAGGVTSGIDFGLQAVAEIAGVTVAQSIQLGIEYNPAPPFNAGHPDTASDEIKATVAGRYATSLAPYEAALAA
jgi:cyclohexyl-isocyanide hydratase